MSRTITIRLTEELADWLKERSRKTGIPMAGIVREQLESARLNSGKQRFMKHIGALRAA
jgi:predicted DNA-binding protein